MIRIIIGLKGSEFISMKFITNPLKVITPIFFKKKIDKKYISNHQLFLRK